jgi:hypothetical protein
MHAKSFIAQAQKQNKQLAEAESKIKEQTQQLENLRWQLERANTDIAKHKQICKHLQDPGQLQRGHSMSQRALPPLLPKKADEKPPPGEAAEADEDADTREDNEGSIRSALTKDGYLVALLSKLPSIPELQNMLQKRFDKEWREFWRNPKEKAYYYALWLLFYLVALSVVLLVLLGAALSLRHLGITLAWIEALLLFFLDPVFAMLGQESDLDNLSEEAMMKGEKAVWGLLRSLKDGMWKVMQKQGINVLVFGSGVKAVNYSWGVMWQTDEKHDFFKVASDLELSILHNVSFSESVTLCTCRAV